MRPDEKYMRGIFFFSSQVICHYTTLNQELTLSANDIPETDDQEFYCRLDIVSDDETATDDDVIFLRIYFIIYICFNYLVLIFFFFCRSCSVR